MHVSIAYAIISYFLYIGHLTKNASSFSFAAAVIGVAIFESSFLYEKTCMRLSPLRVVSNWVLARSSFRFAEDVLTCE